MKTLIIVKHELYNILSNRKFMMSFVLQLIILFALIPTFSTFLASGDIKTAVPTMKEFVPIGIVDFSSRDDILKDALAKNEKLDLKDFDSFPHENLEKGEIASVLIIPRGYDEHSNYRLMLSLFIDQSNLKRWSVYDAVTEAIADASSAIRGIRESKLKTPIPEPIQLDKELLSPMTIDEKGGRFSSFFLAYLLPLVLFFPIFTSGGLVLDSIVGEKEGKTIEPLLASPITPSAIATGKFVAIFAFITAQCVVWLGLLNLLEIPIGNIWMVLLILVLINSAVIATAFTLGIYSDSIKEANISMMLIYVVLLVGLIVFLSMEYFNPIQAFEIIPFTAISRLVVGKGVSSLAIAFVVLALSAYSFSLLMLCVKLLDRDDIVFGPRPPLFHLMNDFTEWLLLRFEAVSVGISVVSFGFASVSVVLSIILEVSLGMVIFFLFGYSFFSLYAITVIFALIEEFLKPLGVYSVANRRPDSVTPLSGFFYGGLSGVGFSLFENIFLGALILFTFPSRVLQTLTYRIGTILLVHAASSGIVGLGINRLTKGDRHTFVSYLLVATAIHAGYNLILVMR
ncbi:MAG: ABC transporter permease [Candidatus Hydrothermarchaeales archaeon]